MSLIATIIAILFIIIALPIILIAENKARKKEDALETLDSLRKQLMEAQQQAEEIYISR